MSKQSVKLFADDQAISAEEIAARIDGVVDKVNDEAKHNSAV